VSNIGKRLAASTTRWIGLLILKWNILFSSGLAEMVESSLNPATIQRWRNGLVTVWRAVVGDFWVIHIRKSKCTVLLIAFSLGIFS
jgi:hypothetical protein